jgi:hypothetical protein
MNAQHQTTSAATRWRWTCAALAAAASLGASVDAPAESVTVTVAPAGQGAARSGQPGGSASARVNFQVVIPPRMEWDSSKGLKPSSNLKGKVQLTVDDSGTVPVHTVSVP